MPSATINGGDKVSAQEITALLTKGLQASKLSSRIKLIVDRAKATALSRLGDAPGRIRAILYFTGWLQPGRTRSGIRQAGWTMEIYANEGVLAPAASTNAAVLTDTELLDAAEELATAMESLEFTGYDILSPELTGSSWILAEDNTTVSGHSLTFTVTYCHPVRPHVQVASPNPPSATGFCPVS